MATAKLMSINKLCEGNDGEPYTFFIPSYQRGYRWEEEQILNLAKDLYEFVDKSKDDDDFYCLQPVIVKEKEDETGNPVLEVVDGQQRLTALWIFYTIRQGSEITHRRSPGSKYSLEYENKEPFTVYLNNINKYIY